MILLAFCFFSFCMGSIPYGYMVAKGFCQIDPRKEGSGNIGATNVGRICGWKYGVLVLLLDVGKGVLPVALANSFLTEIHSGDFLPQNLVPVLAGFFAILGHVYTPFLGGKGGKGVATALGVYLSLVLFSTLLGVLVFLLVFYLFRFVSLGSIIASVSIPLFYLCIVFYLPHGYLGQEEVWNPSVFGFLVLTAFLIVWSHRENLQRLLKGEELSASLQKRESQK